MKVDMDSTNRSSGAKVLRELLSGLEGHQRSRSTAIIRPRLNIDSTRAVVGDNSLVSGGSAADNGGKGSEDAELHFDEREDVFWDARVL